jgi:hypothetical protein
MDNVQKHNTCILVGVWTHTRTSFLSKYNSDVLVWCSTETEKKNNGKVHPILEYILPIFMFT